MLTRAILKDNLAENCQQLPMVKLKFIGVISGVRVKRLDDLLLGIYCSCINVICPRFFDIVS